MLIYWNIIVIVHVDEHAKDLIESPKKPEPEGPKRKPPKKVSSWHLTGIDLLDYTLSKTRDD